MFRPYKKLDMPLIQAIHDQNHKDNGGLLVGPFYHFDNDYYVLEEQNKVIAYVNILQELPERVTLQTDWDIPQQIELQGIYIRQVATDISWQGRGAGTMLYQELFRLFPGKDFYAHVRDSNRQSMHFHQKNAFANVGQFCADEFYGISNYKAFLMCRKTEI